MTLRRASILGFLSFFLFVTSCAEGGGHELPLTQADGAVGPGTPRCGDGIVQAELGEVCECPVGTTEATCMVTNTDCSSLGNETGPLLCEHTMCMYVTTNCMSVGVAGASGGGGGTGS